MDREKYLLVKQWQELEDDKNLKETNIHKFRFARFVRYLRDSEAKITLKRYNEDTGETLPIHYTAASRDGNPGLRELVMELKGIGTSYSDDLFTRPLVMTDRHSGGDSVPKELGKIIHAITFSSFEMDSLYNETGSWFLSEHPFSTRQSIQQQWDQYPKYKSLEKSKRSKIWDHYLKYEYAQTANHVASNLPGVYGKRDDFQLIRQEFQPFLDIAKELIEQDPAMDYVEGSYKNNCDVIYFDYKRNEDLLSILKQIGNYYYNISANPEGKNLKDSSLDSEATIIPGYWDFYYPHNKEAILETIDTYSSRLKLLQLDEQNVNEFIENRYEILWLLEDSPYQVRDWSTAQQALLFVVLSEYRAIHETIRDAAQWIIEDLRFTVVTSDGKDNMDYQHGWKKLSELCDALEDYNFVNGLEQSINIQGQNILNKEIHRFPEPEAVEEKYNREKLREHIEDKLIQHFFYKIRDDLYVDKSMTY